MTGFIALWSHLLAAALYGALAVFQLRLWRGDARNRPLITAFAAMSVWTIFLALLGPYALLTQLAESGRNLAFLAFVYGLLAGAADGGRQRAVKGLFAAVAAVIGLQIVVGGVMPEFQRAPLVFEALASTSQIIGMLIAAGALILVHNLYGQAAPGSRSALRFSMLALAAMWAYDLHLYTVAYFTRAPGAELFALRGLVLAALAPLFLLGVRNATWKIQISRAATFQSVSLVLILVYLVAMMLAARAMEIVGGDWGRIGQVGIIFVMTLTALVLVPSAKLRAWLRVVLAKHLFEHRYDYRQEWLRFTDTVGREGGAGAPLEERVVKALADIGGSPAGLLMTCDEGYRLSPAGRWNWIGAAPAGEGAEVLLRHIESGGFVIEFETIRKGWIATGDARVQVPDWLASIERAWAGIPLIHGGKLAGLVILEHPAFRRPLDWEDFDLFRTAGIQAASYIAEARSQQALADAQPPLRLHHARHQESGEPALPRRPQCRAPCRESRIPRGHDRDPAELGAQDERSARPPFARRRARIRAGASGRGPAADRSARGRTPPAPPGSSQRRSRARRQGRPGRPRTGARTSPPERDRRQRGRSAGRHEFLRKWRRRRHRIGRSRPWHVALLRPRSPVPAVRLDQGIGLRHRRL